MGVPVEHNCIYNNIFGMVVDMEVSKSFRVVKFAECQITDEIFFRWEKQTDVKVKCSIHFNGQRQFHVPRNKEVEDKVV